MKQLRDRMKANQLQVADRVRKHVASARLLPKVVSASCPQPCALRSSHGTQKVAQLAVAAAWRPPEAGCVPTCRSTA